MTTANFIVKIEDNVTRFVHFDEFGYIYTATWPTNITARDEQCFRNDAFETKPRTMISVGTGEKVLSLPVGAHALAGIDINKTEAKFTVRKVSVDFLTNTTTVLEEWDYDVKQWPNGHIHINKTI